MSIFESFESTEYNDETIMSYGKYKGTKLGNVPASYLLWCLDNITNDKLLINYINDNLDTIKNEMTK